jgi:hypothetical protein
MANSTDVSSTREERPAFQTPCTATYEQLKKFAYENPDKLPACCLRCGDNHPTKSCTASFICGTDVSVQITGANFGQYKLSGRRFCYDYGLSGHCDRAACFYAHACTLCGEENGDHPAKACLWFQLQALEAAYMDHVSSSTEWTMKWVGGADWVAVHAG